MSTNPEEIKATAESKFYMDVDPELKELFKEACGLASMAAVTRQLWRVYVASAPMDRYDIVMDAAKNEAVTNQESVG